MELFIAIIYLVLIQRRRKTISFFSSSSSSSGRDAGRGGKKKVLARRHRFLSSSFLNSGDSFFFFKLKMHRWGAGRAVGGDTRKRKLRLELFLFCFLLKYFFAAGKWHTIREISRPTAQVRKLRNYVSSSSFIINCFSLPTGPRDYLEQSPRWWTFFPPSSLYKLRTIGRSGSRKLRHGEVRTETGI